MIRFDSIVGSRCPFGQALLVFGVAMAMAGLLEIGSSSPLITVLIVVIFVVILPLLVVFVVLILLSCVIGLCFGRLLLFMLLGIPFSLFLDNRYIESVNVSATAIVAVTDVTILVVWMRSIGGQCTLLKLAQARELLLELP